jgi:hypothetical protein
LSVVSGREAVLERRADLLLVDRLARVELLGRGIGLRGFASHCARVSPSGSCESGWCLQRADHRELRRRAERPR